MIRYTRPIAPLAVATAGLALTALLAGCGSTAKATSTGALGTPSLAPIPSHTTGQPTAAATATDTSTTTGTSTHKTSTTSKITVFRVKQQPACPVVPASDAPFTTPGTDIVLEWAVTGPAIGVALSLDDPSFFSKNQTGNYDNYPTSNTLDLPFNCDPTVQPNTTHQYTIDTIGGGKTVQKTITVTVQTSP